MGKYTRWLLWVVLGSLALAAGAAILSIAGLLRESGTLFGSIATVVLFGLTAMGSAVVYEKGRWRGLMKVSLVVSAVGLVIYLVVIWALSSHGDSGLITRVMGCSAIWAIALPHMGLMSLARLGGWKGVVRSSTMIVVLVLACWMTVISLWQPDYQIVDRWQIWQLTGIGFVLMLLGTVTVPVLHWLYATPVELPAESTRLELEVKCPRCLREQTLPNGRSTCAGCGLKFELKVEEPRCECGYLLFRLASPQCPECGRDVNGSATVLASL